MRRIAALAALLGSAVAMTTTAAWQSPTPQPRFQATTELVTIDVVATRADGKPATGLTAADFELFEDGRPQVISAFQFVDLTTLPILARLPLGVVSNQDEPGALFAIVLDELGVQVDDVQQVRRVASRFLDEALLPQDHVAVVRSGANSGFFLTNDKTIALDAAARSTGRRDRGLRLEAPGPDVEATPVPDIETLTPGATGKKSFEVLLDVIEKFRPITARRKAILWFSRGGEVEYEDGVDELIAERASPRADDAFVKVIQAARAANVAIYTVDPRGLMARSTLGRKISPEQPMDELATLRDLATATGGRAIVNANDLNGALVRVAAENRAYYLLGYQPVRQGGTRGRKLEVRTRVAGVSLLHRSVYLPRRADEKSAELPLMASPLPVRDLPISLAPAEVAGVRGRRGVVVPFEIGAGLADDLEVDYNVSAFDTAGRSAATATGRLKAKGGRAVGTAQLALDDQAYQLRVAATLKDGSRQGLAFATVNIASAKAAAPVCGGFVFEQPGGGGAIRQFSRSAPLTISTVVSAKSLDGITLAFGLGSADGPPERTWPVPVGRPIASGLWQFSLSLKPRLPGGNAEIMLLNGNALLGEGCRAGLSLR